MEDLCFLIILGIAILIGPFMMKNADAYIDPGTTSVVFSVLAYVVSGAAVILAFLIRPIRNLFKSLKKEKKTESTHPE